MKIKRCFQTDAEKFWMKANKIVRCSLLWFELRRSNEFLKSVSIFFWLIFAYLFDFSQLPCRASLSLSHIENDCYRGLFVRKHVCRVAFFVYSHHWPEIISIGSFVYSQRRFSTRIFVSSSLVYSMEIDINNIPTNYCAHTSLFRCLDCIQLLNC